MPCPRQLVPIGLRLSLRRVDKPAIALAQTAQVNPGYERSRCVATLRLRSRALVLAFREHLLRDHRLVEVGESELQLPPLLTERLERCEIRLARRTREWRTHCAPRADADGKTRADADGKTRGATVRAAGGRQRAELLVHAARLLLRCASGGGRLVPWRVERLLAIERRAKRLEALVELASCRVKGGGIGCRRFRQVGGVLIGGGLIGDGRRCGRVVRGGRRCGRVVRGGRRCGRVVSRRKRRGRVTDESRSGKENCGENRSLVSLACSILARRALERLRRPRHCRRLRLRLRLRPPPPSPQRHAASLRALQLARGGPLLGFDPPAPPHTRDCASRGALHLARGADRREEPSALRIRPRLCLEPRRRPGAVRSECRL